jgi:hypothetical protein
MNTDTFRTDAASVIYQTSLVWSKGNEQPALYLVSQDLPAIQDYAAKVTGKESPSKVAGQVSNRFLLEVQ